MQGRALDSFTFRLNVSSFCRICGWFRGVSVTKRLMFSCS